MRPALYNTDDLERFLMENIVATMPQIQKALEMAVSKTVMRKLKQLSYRSSYTHGGGYYTLDSIARFDRRGLWSHGDVRFSNHGTLMSTLRHFVIESESGYCAGELKQILSVSVKESLLRLTASGQVSREKVDNRFFYYSPDPTVRKRQILSRTVEASEESALSDEAKAAIVIFFSMLDEQQRRLYAGVEAIKYGFGGDQWIAKILGMHPHTVARGRRALLTQDVETERVRRKGGGRKRVEKKHPRSSEESKP